jgi:hypothetical protein
MLSHCANSTCSRPFLRLRQGKLFLVETEFVGRSGELRAPPAPHMRQPRRVERSCCVTGAQRCGRWCTTEGRGLYWWHCHADHLLRAW